MDTSSLAYVPSPEHAPTQWALARIAEYEAGIAERRTLEELVEDLAAAGEMTAREEMAFAIGYLSPSYSFSLYVHSPE
jgi:hypothetical protein